jgi:hypothetical protein
MLDYNIKIPTDGMFVRGVVVYETTNIEGLKSISTMPIGETTSWDRMGFLQAAYLKEERYYRMLLGHE